MLLLIKYVSGWCQSEPLSCLKQILAFYKTLKLSLLAFSWWVLPTYH